MKILRTSTLLSGAVLRIAAGLGGALLAFLALKKKKD